MRTDRYYQEKKRKSGVLKKLVLTILILAAAVCAAVALLFFNAQKSIDLVFTEDVPQIEFGGEYSAESFIRSSVGIVAPESDAIDTSVVGEGELKYTVTKPVLGGLLVPEREFILKYSVTDTAAPVILWNSGSITLTKGSEFEIDNYLAYGDNADPAPKLTVTGDVNTDKTGDYPLHIIVTDSSGNSADCSMNVTIVDSAPGSYSYSAERVDFSDFVSRYKGKGRTFGIDVSAWQGIIDFEKVKKAGCDFVVIRIGYSSGESDVVSIDSRFRQNLERAKKAGLRIGLYLYSSDNNEETVRESARIIVKELDGETLDLPVAFDWEDFVHFQSYGISFAELNGLYDAFAEELAAAGYDCMLYSSLNYAEKVWEDKDKRPLWLAHYTDKLTYKGPVSIWQAGNTGRIDGIGVDVDLDVKFGE